MRFTFETSAILALLPLALADSLTLYLPSNPNPFSIPANTHATLSSAGVHFSAPLSSANTFVFHNVTPGSYLADVHWEVVQVKEGSKGRGFELRAIGGKNYFMERPQFSVFAILKNPMILMALVSLVLMVGMPKLMDSMDPEMRAEFEAQRKNSPLSAAMTGQSSGDNPLTNFDMAAYLAGSKPKESTPANNGGNGNTKNQGVRR
ncbi:ER membrane protein complex subunit 7 [Fusarium oxysporum f. sp. raphani]|uniref:ER membrane protein complex subunit 7 n=1 Tax=Fusarium oxysporum f. sp. raphani TaxID=96318 RepID=A0A8J5UD17_FUSOX|nr:ER membrane protein complex subunit 7 [Fusarium oxysporum f. sp. raphani]